jgi:hypothetical protein
MMIQRTIALASATLAFLAAAWSNGNGEISDGKIEGDDLSWVEMLKFQDMDLRIEYKAKLSGDELRISHKVADIATEEGVAKRVN